MFDVSLGSNLVHFRLCSSLVYRSIGIPFTVYSMGYSARYRIARLTLLLFKQSEGIMSKHLCTLAWFFYIIRTHLDNPLHNQIHLILRSVNGTNANYAPV